MSQTETDQRRFSSTFTKPTRVRFRHDGNVVYDKVHEGDVEIFLRDHNVPYAGVTEVLLGDSDKALATYKCS